MQRDNFEDIVREAVASMPAEFGELLENIDIVVDDWPSREQLKKVGLRRRNELLGLYEGIPRTARGQNYNLVLPDKITVFQKPLESLCGSEKELKLEIIRTVKHEIAHYFGIDDNRLDEIEKEG
jgi:predicted Zn-dependent protease with MMP-like domain